MDENTVALVKYRLAKAKDELELAELCIQHKKIF